ncbi:MAG: hypothetical protein M1834_001688 [Cirrosporium novae-zelandiae]|nr:MAG: hypothetical protein M1834_001688 [Cirrosporium novae-zelandiae]
MSTKLGPKLSPEAIIFLERLKEWLPQAKFTVNEIGNRTYNDEKLGTCYAIADAFESSESGIHRSAIFNPYAYTQLDRPWISDPYPYIGTATYCVRRSIRIWKDHIF